MKAEGKCLFCEKTYKKVGINKHLKTHLENKIKESQPGKSYFVKIVPAKDYGKTPFFLSLWINGETSFSALDDFLREIWLECCGHLSAFTKAKNSTLGGADEIPKSKKVKLKFDRGVKFDYDYDFGSTTALEIEVLEEFPIKADKPIVLLSRNEPLEVLCDSCKEKPAVSICTVCMDDWEGESMFCEKCAKKHAKTCEDFEDYAAMPIVNSPRMGVCGYEGGTIDTKRDGNIPKPQ